MEHSLQLNQTLLLTVSGSRAYGTNVPESDFDVNGVFITSYKDRNGYLPTPTGLKGQEIQGVVNTFLPPEALAQLGGKPVDGNTHELRRFFSIAATGNPNILEVLYAEEPSRLYTSPLGRVLLDHRHLFLSRRVCETYRGYARTQGEYMTRLVESGASTSNPHRQALRDKYGYDCKFAMHLVRILRTGQEILSEGVVNVWRKDAEELVAIRNGAWTFPEVLAYAEDAAQKILDLRSKSILPEQPDTDVLNKLCQDITEMYDTGIAR